jgi:hypothetical protein
MKFEIMNAIFIKNFKNNKFLLKFNLIFTNTFLFLILN